MTDRETISHGVVGIGASIGSVWASINFDHVEQYGRILGVYGGFGVALLTGYKLLRGKGKDATDASLLIERDKANAHCAELQHELDDERAKHRDVPPHFQPDDLGD